MRKSGFYVSILGSVVFAAASLGWAPTASAGENVLYRGQCPVGDDGTVDKKCEDSYWEHCLANGGNALDIYPDGTIVCVQVTPEAKANPGSVLKTPTQPPPGAPGRHKGGDSSGGNDQTERRSANAS